MVPKERAEEMIDLKMAEKIRDAFGPCSSLYECWDLETIVERTNDEGGSVSKFVKTQLVVESIVTERMMEGIEDPDERRDFREENRVFMEELKKRVAPFLTT